NRMADLVQHPNQLMFTDEASRDRRTQQRKFGYALKGRRCTVRRHFVCSSRITILPVLTLEGIITYDLIPGPVNSERFLQFLRELVIPLTNPYPGP
ncbi:hypothetical protein K435DRAFT_611476, partial [Dendrothele bispora CBS 962.96]